jgi:hypothetical protein
MKISSLIASPFLICHTERSDAAINTVCIHDATIIGFNTVCISTQYISCRRGNVRSLPADGSGLINHQTRLYLLSRFSKQQLFFKIYLIIKFLPDGNSAPNIELAEGI